MNSLRLKIYFGLLLVYILLLIYLYVPLPEKVVDDVGSIKFISCTQTNCAVFLTELIQASQETKCVLYDLDEDSLFQVFDEKSVPVLLFEENYEEDFSEFIQPVKSLGLMHHKFCIFDESYILTGTWNPTERGTYYNDNYVIFIQSSALAKEYLKEYERVESFKQATSRGLKVSLSDMDIRTCMTRQENCENLIIKEIEKAEETISVLAFTFTSKPVAEALIEATLRGVEVLVIFEKTRITQYCVIHRFEGSLVQSYLDGNKYVMHEKMFLIDNSTAIVGSYNPTKGAQEKNDENILIIQGDVNFMNKANEEFGRILEVAVLR